MVLSGKTRDLPRFVAPILLGLLVSAVGTLPWVAMVRLNAINRPEIPWAAGATALHLGIFLAWLNGAGPPARWKAARRFHLRLWPQGLASRPTRGIGLTLSLMAAILLLALVWIAVAAPGRPPDLSAYPTTAHRVSALVMTPLVAAVVEEAAFRGYMQRGLEKYGAERAVVVSAFIFALAHASHGLETLLTLGPGIFVAGLLYGALARHSGSILPGMLVHFLGDLAYFYFGLLGGDWRLLIVA